jgi:L-alanine-DL-glutamate epimerase-like enolase superfamily enzyme
MEVPNGPGLGVELNPEALRRHPFVKHAAQPFDLR